MSRRTIPRPIPLTPALLSQRLREPQPERIELDEALGVALVVDLVLLEGDVCEAIEALRRFAPDHAGEALVELEAHGALDAVLALVDHRLQHQPLRREPEPVVDELGIARHELVLEVRRAAIEGDALDAAMRCVHERAAGRLVDAARLHADETVLHEIEAADAMLAAKLVQTLQQG